MLRHNIAEYEPSRRRRFATLRLFFVDR
jgi:hypothetical protein